MELAREIDSQLVRFPNARVNDDEQRKLRAGLYRPLLALDATERARVVDHALAILFDRYGDA